MWRNPAEYRLSITLRGLHLDSSYTLTVGNTLQSGNDAVRWEESSSLAYAGL